MAGFPPIESASSQFYKREWPELVNFDERMASLMAVFPLYDLLGKHSLRDYHGFELGVSFLLFVLEKMLRYESCTNEEAEAFIARVLPLFTGRHIGHAEAYQVTEKLLLELTNAGRPFEYSFTSPEAGGERLLKFRLLEQQPVPGQDLISLKLTNQGLDLLFKSREIYRDLQFSVMQLYLDQQIRRGTFEGALQTVNELGAALTGMEQETEALREQVRRNVVEAIEGHGYHRLLKRMSEQLDRERETFDNLITLVRQTHQNLEQSPRPDDKERLLNVERLERRLYEVAQRHLRMFNRQLDLNLLVEDALRASLYSTLTVRFHLEKELLAEVLRLNPSNLVAIRVGVLPLLRPRQPRLFTLGTFLGSQNLIGRERERPPEAFSEELDTAALVAREAVEREQHARTTGLLRRFFQLLLAPLVEVPRTSLGAITEDWTMEVWQAEEMQAFAHLVLLLHQAGAVPAHLPWEHVPGDGDLLELALYSILQEHSDLADLGVVRVQALEKILTLPHGVEITEMCLEREDQHAV